MPDVSEILPDRSHTTTNVRSKLPRSSNCVTPIITNNSSEFGVPSFRKFPPRPGSRTSSIRSISRSTPRQTEKSPLPLPNLKEYKSPKSSSATRK